MSSENLAKIPMTEIKWGKIDKKRNLVKSIKTSVFLSLLTLTGLNLITAKVKTTALFVGSFDTDSVLSYDGETG